MFEREIQEKKKFIKNQTQIMIYKLRQIRMNDTRNKHMGWNNMTLMQDNLVIQYFSFFVLDQEFVLCCLGSHDAGILSCDEVHRCPASLSSHMHYHGSQMLLQSM